MHNRILQAGYIPVWLVHRMSRTVGLFVAQQKVIISYSTRIP